MSDTPRTDAEVAGISWFVTDSDQRAYSATDYECLRDFARQLERELAAAKAEAERLREALEAIAEGCSFPSDSVQKAVRDRARAALAATRKDSNG